MKPSVPLDCTLCGDDLCANLRERAKDICYTLLSLNMGQGRLEKSTLDIPRWSAESSLSQEKYNTYRAVTGSYGYISRFIPQQRFSQAARCESECAFCSRCIERFGYEYCSMHDMCWGCSRCLSENLLVRQ
jgi:hypothetical protein